MSYKTFYHYICPAGHRGIVIEKENDQMYSENWSITRVEGMTSAAIGGKEGYVCKTCGQVMSTAPEPKD